MSHETVSKLEAIAEAMSTPQRKVSPMQVAAQLLEEAVCRVQAKTVNQSKPSNGNSQHRKKNAKSARKKA